MICPKCQKQKNEEVNIEFIPSIKSFQRKRKCKCGYIFTTYEHVAPDNMIIDKLDFLFLLNIYNSFPELKVEFIS